MAHGLHSWVGPSSDGGYVGSDANSFLFAIIAHAPGTFVCLMQESVVMSEIVGLEPLAIAAVVRSFYGLVFKHGDHLLSQAERIASPAVRRAAAKQTARTVASTYGHIHALVSRPGSGYQQPETILLHSPEEIEALLGL